MAEKRTLRGISHRAGQNPEPFALCGVPQAVIKTHKFVTTRTALNPYERRGQLAGICRAERMQQKRSSRLLPNRLTRRDLCPICGKRCQDRASLFF